MALSNENRGGGTAKRYEPGAPAKFEFLQPSPPRLSSRRRRFLMNPGHRAHSPFHEYTMRQAIEEGFIMDVLQYYTTYKRFSG